MSDNEFESERARALQLLWLSARTLCHIDQTLTNIAAQLTDVAVLSQQQVDLLRRVVERTSMP